MGHALSIWGIPHIDTSNMGMHVRSIWGMPHIDIVDMGLTPYQQIKMEMKYGAHFVNMG